jgi:hypothetical protein
MSGWEDWSGKWNTMENIISIHINQIEIVSPVLGRSRGVITVVSLYTYEDELDKIDRGDRNTKSFIEIHP